MSCILSLVGGPAQRVQVLDWILLLIKTIMPMTKVIMIFFMAMMMTMMMMTIRKPSDQVKFANISVGGRECRTVHDPVTGRSPPLSIFIPSSSPPSLSY